LATDHLLKQGHRRIGVVIGIPGLATSDDRRAGYLKAHADHGVKADATLEVEGDFDQSTAQAGVAALLARKNPPTGIVVISNMMTVGTLFAIREAGLRVPEDISLVGID